MFSLFKPKQSGTEIGLELCRILQEGYAAGFSGSQDLFPTEPQISLEAVKDEWLYLEVFSVDFSVYLAVGDTPAKAAVLTPFWVCIRQWLQAKRANELPERLVVAGGGPRVIPAENSESSFSRLSRRMQQYGSAITSPHAQGENYSVAAVLASACGDMGAISTLGVTEFFSSRKISIVQFIRKFRIVV